MSAIFISYASPDRSQARLIAEILSERGYSVWWDRMITAGTTFDEVIDTALDSATCVVVLWSGHSITSNWTKSEAEEGLKRGTLIPILLEDVRIPLPFRRLHSVNLVGWGGLSNHPGIEDLLTAIQHAINRAVVNDSHPGGHGITPDTAQSYEYTVNDITFPLLITLDEAAVGTVKRIHFERTRQCSLCHSDSRSAASCKRCNGRGTETKQTSLSVKIPAGVDTGDRIRLAGEGHTCGSDLTGDLYIRIAVREHEEFSRNGLDIYMTTAISADVAKGGGKIKVKALTRTFMLTIPQGTISRRVFKIRGAGIKDVRSNNYGDLFCKVLVAGQD